MKKPIIASLALIFGCALAWGRAGLPSHNPILTAGGTGGATPIYNNFASGSCNSSNPQSIVNVPIGTATSDRIVVIVVNIDNSGGSFRTASAATIGGISATIDIQSAANPNVVIMHAPVPSGTTATVQFNVSGTSNVCDVYSYSLYGLVSSTPDSTNNTGGTQVGLTTTLNYVTGGVAVAGYALHGNGGTITWSGLTVDDFRLNANGNSESGAHQASLAGQTGASITATSSGSAQPSNLSAASWH